MGSRKTSPARAGGDPAFTRLRALRRLLPGLECAHYPDEFQLVDASDGGASRDIAYRARGFEARPGTVGVAGIGLNPPRLNEAR